MSVETFGRTADGHDVYRVQISGGGLKASVITFGAAIQDLRIEGHGFPLVLGFETFEPYETHAAFFGAIAGRYANRIRGGRFTIDGERYHADTNFLGRHLLHGGSRGFDRRLWTIEGSDAHGVTLRHMSERGDMGFPGALEVTCAYRLLPGGRLTMTLCAETDAPTLCNLAHHSYFNLDDGGRTSIRDHRLEIRGEAYLPVDDDMIPTGHVVPVEETAFDFRLARTVESDEGQLYDHNFCLSAERGAARRVAWAQGATSGLEMEVWTGEPGLQFYDGAHLAGEGPGLGGIRYHAHAGFCLEPQVWPDSPNRPYFPQAVLRPGETYRQETEYRFKVG